MRGRAPKDALFGADRDAKFHHLVQLASTLMSHWPFCGESPPREEVQGNPICRDESVWGRIRRTLSRRRNIDIDRHALFPNLDLFSVQDQVP